MNWGRRRGNRWLLAGALGALLAAGVVVLMAALSSGGGGAPRGVPSHSTSGTGPAVTPGAPPTAGPPAQAAPKGIAFGANVNRTFQDPRFASVSDAQIAALARTGATVARTDALWEASEPAAPVRGAHHYDWRFDDGIAATLARHGLRWLPIIDYTAGWAQSVAGADHSPPRSLADYAAYAGAFAARYGPGGGFWSAHPELPSLPVDTIEIWNEPDNPPFWTPTPDAALYARMYLQARDAITLVQPSVRAIVGGLQHPASFLAQMLQARPDLAGHVDGVAVHPYAHTPGQIVDRVRADRAALNRLGLGSVPLYVTEFGWTTSPRGAHDYLPASTRPAYLTFTLAELGHLACGVAAVTVYTWVTAQQDRRDAEQWYGVDPPGGGSSPDVAAVGAGFRAAAAPGAATPC